MKESVMYMVYELRDSLPIGIEKNSELLEIEKEFAEVINASGKKEKFQFMLDDWEANKTQLEKSIKSMTFRKETAVKLIKMYENEKDKDKKELIDKIVSMVFTILGVEPERTESTNA